MRYDSEPQIVRRILTEAEALHEFLNRSEVTGTIAQPLSDELESLVGLLRKTLDHFSKLHILNPQLSLSRFSASHIEGKLQSIQESIIALFQQKQFVNLYEKMEWYRDRFLHPHSIIDHEQLLISMYKRIEQVLETYYVDRIRNSHIAAILNEFVGWSEHIELQGHHDVHGVILFAEKVARDNAIIEHRTEVVRDICLLIEDRSFFQDTAEESTETISLELSHVYTPYLLELYEVLLEDMEIIAISNQDYRAFEKYCRKNDIDVYEEYHDILTEHFRKYVEIISADISAMLHIVRTANNVVNAELIHRRYFEVSTPLEVLGENLAKDIRGLDHAIRQIRHFYPDLGQQYTETLRKVKKFKGEIMKPAIEVYGKYLEDPKEFFHQLPQNLSRWIPILDSALACLEQHDDLYQKCSQLKNQIDDFVMR